MSSFPNRSRVLAPFGVLLAGFLLFLGFSLPHVVDPPIGTHGWRQSIATSVARLYAAGQPFLYPRAEGCGAEPGTHMGYEFPLYSWLMGKLGGPDGINLVGRLIGLLSALALMVAVFAIVRHLLRGWQEPHRTFTAVAAGTFFAVSPLFRFYGISFVPDLPAHALALLGAAVLTGPLFSKDDTLKPLSFGRLMVAGLLISLGVLTKLIALPHMALAGLVLLDRSRPRESFGGFKSWRPYVMGLLLLAVVLVPAWLWYKHWVPVLKQGGCELCWLPDQMDDSWKTMTFTDAEWRRRMSTWGREDLLGPAWLACLVGIPLMLFAGWRGLVYLVWAAGCAFGFVRLGWHTKQHDYDFLLVLPALAVGFGASLGVVTVVLGAIGRKLPFKPKPWLSASLPYLALAGVVAAVSPYAHRQSRRHFYTSVEEVGLQRMVDKVLPAGEPIHYFGGRNDPRIPYFAGRQAWGTELWFYCQQKQVSYDCVLAVGTNGKLDPCIERRPSVAWANLSLVCGIMKPESARAAPRILETIAKTIRSPAERAVSGVGRFLGSDPRECGESIRFVCAGNLENKRYLDLYFLPDRDAPQVEVLVNGQPAQLNPPPAKWLEGTVIVAQVELPADAPAQLAVRAGGETFQVPTK